MDHRVEAAERIDLSGDVLGAGDGLDVADHDRFGLGQFSPSVLGTVGVAGMQDDLVALADEQISGHEAEAGGRAGNEDA